MFQENTASIGNTISFKFSNGQVDKCKFKDNVGYDQSKNIFISHSNVSITNSDFRQSETLGFDPTKSQNVIGTFILCQNNA